MAPTSFQPAIANRSGLYGRSKTNGWVAHSIWSGGGFLFARGNVVFRVALDLWEEIRYDDSHFPHIPSQRSVHCPIDVTPEERATLEEWARRRKIRRALVLRAWIVLPCAGAFLSKGAARLGVSPPIFGKWRQRFVAARFPDLADAPRSRAPRRLSDAQVEAVITTALEERPPDATHWSPRSLAHTLGLSHPAVSRIWRAVGLQPHRTAAFQRSTDPFFVDKVRDVVGLDRDPSERAVVFYMEEKTHIQAINRMPPIFPLRPGSNGGATITHGWGRRACLPPPTWRRAWSWSWSWGICGSGIGPRRSSNSSNRGAHGPRGPGGVPGLGPRRNPQESPDPAGVGPTATAPPARHSHRLVLAHHPETVVVGPPLGANSWFRTVGQERTLSFGSGHSTRRMAHPYVGVQDPPA
ncbi:MAG: helix-turn-helix domain-containing protein [Clostridia bacterium]